MEPRGPTADCVQFVPLSWQPRVVQGVRMEGGVCVHVGEDGGWCVQPMNMRL